MSGTPWGVVAGDFDADGVTDLATAGAAGYVSVLLGNGADGAGDGTFAAAVNHADRLAGRGALAPGTSTRTASPTSPSAASAGVAVLRGLGADGRGDGTFGPATIHACEVSPQAVATGDFDADGVTDLAVANAGSGSVSILLGAGDGSFAAAVGHAAGLSPGAIAIGDWNGDGAADLAVANGSSANTVSILCGQRSGGAPDGTFAPPQAFAAGTWARGVTAGDFDGDGMADLAVANKVSGRDGLGPAGRLRRARCRTRSR